MATPALALEYWLTTTPIMLDALAGQSGLKRIEVAELLVEVERELLSHAINPPPEVHDGVVVDAYLDLLMGLPHGKHSFLV